MRYKINRKFENIYIKYLEAKGSIDPILPIFAQGHAVITKYSPRISILELKEGALYSIKNQPYTPLRNLSLVALLFSELSRF